MQDPTIGITCADTRRVVREALRGGWTWDGMTGTTHARLVWPGTGARVIFGLTPSVASWKSLATTITKVSGVEVWRKGNRKRSHKADQLSGFSLDVAERDMAAWHERWAGRVEQLIERHSEAVAEFERLIDTGSARVLPRAREVLSVIRTSEAQLRELNQPVIDYTPAGFENA